jgi:predicted XRE-type DNA-binding protein
VTPIGRFRKIRPKGPKAVEDHDGNRFRAVHTVKFAGAVYVLHAFQKKSKKAEKADRIEQLSRNVFADLGLNNPAELLAKAELVQRIADILAERKLTQVRAEKLLGVDQPKVSALLRGKRGGFSIDRLFRFLNALGRDVDNCHSACKTR